MTVFLLEAKVQGWAGSELAGDVPGKPFLKVK
jgi:hypothetical protein